MNKEEREEYNKRILSVYNRTKEILHKVITLHKSELTEKNLTEYLKENNKLKNEFNSVLNERKKIDNEFGIYY